jgi:hypothetical protein
VLANEVRRRADRHPVRVAPGLIADLLVDSRVVVGGADALMSSAAVAKAAQHIIYVRSSRLVGLVADFFALDEAVNPNVVMCAVDDEAWMLDEGVGIATAIVDLIDQGDVRAAGEALRAFA